MAISDELRKEFNERVRPIKEKINDCLKKEKDESFALRSAKEGIEEKKILLCR